MVWMCHPHHCIVRRALHDRQVSRQAGDIGRDIEARRTANRPRNLAKPGRR